MADLLSTGISGVRTYQRALATVGNNIANVDTDGYSRQRLEIVENSSTGSGVLNIGNGARATQVQRVYDSFVTSSLRVNTSQLEQHQAINKYAQQLENTLADKQLSLSKVMDSFYASVQELSVSPSSSAARQNMLNVAESVTSQFHAIGDQIGRIVDDSYAELGSEVEELNRLAQQLASVNTSLSKNIDIKKQPNELLDARDKLLQDMSKLVRITAEMQDNGQVNVHIGDADAGEYLVYGKQSALVGVQPNPVNPEEAMLVMDPNMHPKQVTNVSGGSIGGIMNFRTDVLKSLRDELDTVAKVFTNANNEVHELGVNAYGNFGGELFSLANVYNVEPGLNKGNAQVHISTISDVDIDKAPMQLEYEASQKQWTLTNLNTNESVSGTGELVLGGIKVQVSGTGVDGDVFALQPSKRAIDAITVAITDNNSVAAGGALSVGRDPSNPTETRILLDHYSKPSAPAEDNSMDQLLRNNIAEVAANPVATSNQPAFVIPAFTQDARFFMEADGTSSTVEMQVFTRSGRQVFGEPIDSSQQTLMMTPLNGFSADAIYNTDYLNQTGANAYLDAGFVVTNPDANDSRDHFALQGHINEDLIVFVTGSGTANMSGQWGEKAVTDQRDMLRQNVDVKFGANGAYELIDADSNTSIANGTLGNNGISHNSWQVNFDGPVNDGDVFHIKGNAYLSGDNRNMLAMAELQSDKAVFSGRGDFSEVYTDIIGDLGNTVIQTSISAQAQSIMVEQAQAQRDEASAVSLDEEAANLLRFQQAYQASAQVISTANKLFDAILQLG